MKSVTSRIPECRQVLRYGFVGVASNLFGYLLYLLITLLGVDPKIVVGLLYPVGAVTAYFGHAKYSFSYGGRNTRALPRYCLSHLVGYGANLLLLFVFSDLLKFPHQAVQACAILAVAGILFLMFKYYVFPGAERCVR